MFNTYVHIFNVLGGCLRLLNHCEQLYHYRPRVGQYLCMWTPELGLGLEWIDHFEGLSLSVSVAGTVS